MVNLLKAFKKIELTIYDHRYTSLSDYLGMPLAVGSYPKTSSDRTTNKAELLDNSGWTEKEPYPVRMSTKTRENPNYTEIILKFANITIFSL